MGSELVNPSISTPVSIANGGTGSATQNFVDLTTNQTIAGNKTITDKVFFPTTSDTVPSISFTDDTTLGISRSNNNTMSFISNGVEMARYASAATFNVQLRAINGSVSSPSVSIGSVLSTGFYRPSAGNIGVTIAGTQYVNINATDFTIENNLDHDGSNIGFFGVTPVARATELTDELTTVTHTAPVTPDYAISAPVDSSGGAAFGFANANEFNTLMSVVANLQTRVNELETKLTAYGLLTDAD